MVVGLDRLRYQRTPVRKIEMEKLDSVTATEVVIGGGELSIGSLAVKGGSTATALISNG